MDKETIVIGMMRMPGNSHNAENIKIAVETMVNKYDFDKSKIYGTSLLLIIWVNTLHKTYAFTKGFHVMKGRLLLDCLDNWSL